MRERKRGYFSRGSRAFLHFHEDAGDLYADVKLDGTFQRTPVTTAADQACRLLSRIARQDEQPARDPCYSMGRSV